MRTRILLDENPRRGAFSFVLLVAGLALSACHPGNEEAKRLRRSCDAGEFAACNKLAIKCRRANTSFATNRAPPAVRPACTGGVGDGCARASASMLPARRRRQARLGPRADAVPAGLRARRDGRLRAPRRAVSTGAGVPRDLARAASLFQQACDGDNLGLRAPRHAVRRRRRRCAGLRAGRRPVQESCDAKVALGCLGLGRLHAAGTGVPRNDSTAASCSSVRATATRSRAVSISPELTSPGRACRRIFSAPPSCIARRARRNRRSVRPTRRTVRQGCRRPSRRRSEPRRMMKRACDYGYAEACAKAEGAT